MPDGLVDYVAETFSCCLSEGVFPCLWKRSRLVLIPKSKSNSSGGITKARPICLLNDIGKLLERIIMARLLAFMEDTPSADLSDRQYGFKRGRSTTDALDFVVSTIYRGTKKSHFTIAVGLNVKNVFNSVSWPAIRHMLSRKGFPLYLWKIIDHYLYERVVFIITVPIIDGTLTKRAISCGVPQGSVLGRLLWNLTFNFILEKRHEAEERVICYADDTIVLATGATAEARSRVNDQVSVIGRRIEALGLQLAEEKTEAVLFYGGVKLDISSVIRVGRTCVSMRRSMRYSGTILDSKMTFLPHFKYVRDKVDSVTHVLSRLMPNLRSPNEKKRRLYASVIEFIVLYGVPIWGQTLLELRVTLKIVRNIQRPVANRVCSAYRTVSRDVVMLLSRQPPYELVAAERKRIYDRCADLRKTTNWSEDDIKRIKAEEKLVLQREWIEMYSRRDVAGIRTRDAIIPNVGAWMRGWGEIAFHITQLLTGHGYFGTYLHRIGKESDPSCKHCSDGCDSSEHTLEWCPAWGVPRADLCEVVGEDLSLVNIVRKICEDRAAWTAFSKFASTVMICKEDAERARQAAAVESP